MTALLKAGWEQSVAKGYFCHAEYGEARFDIHEATTIAKKRVPQPLRPKPCLRRFPLIDIANSSSHCYLCGRDTR